MSYPIKNPGIEAGFFINLLVCYMYSAKQIMKVFGVIQSKEISSRAPCGSNYIWAMS